MHEKGKALAHRICPVPARAPIIDADSGEGFLLGSYSGENAACATAAGERRAENERAHPQSK